MEEKKRMKLLVVLLDSINFLGDVPAVENLRDALSKPASCSSTFIHMNTSVRRRRTPQRRGTV